MRINTKQIEVKNHRPTDKVKSNHFYVEASVKRLATYCDRYIVSMVSPPFQVSITFIGYEILWHVHECRVPSRVVFHQHSYSRQGTDEHVPTQVNLKASVEQSILTSSYISCFIYLACCYSKSILFTPRGWHFAKLHERVNFFFQALVKPLHYS